MSEQPTPEQTEQIVNSLATGRRIQAIKLYREATGKGLKDAKDFIDSLVPKLIEQDPEKYAALSRQGSGCASVLVIALSLGAATALVVRAIGG